MCRPWRQHCFTITHAPGGVIPHPTNTEHMGGPASEAQPEFESMFRWGLSFHTRTCPKYFQPPLPLLGGCLFCGLSRDSHRNSLYLVQAGDFTSSFFKRPGRFYNFCHARRKEVRHRDLFQHLCPHSEISCLTPCSCSVFLCFLCI